MQADYVLNYNVFSRLSGGSLYLMARIKGRSTPLSSNRRPLNLSVVLDRSGSMGGDKIAYVKQAASFLVDHLSAQDTFSLVSYDNEVFVTVKPAPPVAKDAIKRLIDELRPRGATNLSGGWLQGCQCAEEGRKEDGVNRVLLLTDGLANQGITEPHRLISMARQKRDEGITTTTMGVGMDFNEDLLTKMAAQGGGAFYFIDNPDQAPSIFQEELKDLLNVVGQNLTITLTLEAGTHYIRQWNAYPSEAVTNQVVFRMGDLFADEEKTLLIEVSVSEAMQLGEQTIARLRFDYDALEDERATHQGLELAVKINVVDEDREALSAPPNPDVTKAVLMLRAARARDEAIRHADTGSFERATSVLKEAADAIRDSAIEDDELQSEHDLLREEAVNMELGEERYDSYTRKTATTMSFMGDRSARFQEMKAESTGRLRGARTSVERHGDPPGIIRWGKHSRSLDRDRITIGRDKTNDIILKDQEVSKIHCQIIKEGKDFFLEDLGSKNGTFANGGRVIGRHRLAAGDVMTVHKTMFTLEA